MKKPSAASRTMGLFGDDPRPPPPAFGSLERETRGGFPERSGQPSLFGPLQLEIGDRERLDRDAARRASAAPRDATAASIARQQEKIDAARAAQDEEREAGEARGVALLAVADAEATLKAARASLKVADAALAKAKAKAAKAAKGIR